MWGYVISYSRRHFFAVTGRLAVLSVISVAPLPPPFRLARRVLDVGDGPAIDELGKRLAHRVGVGVILQLALQLAVGNARLAAGAGFRAGLDLLDDELFQLVLFQLLWRHRLCGSHCVSRIGFC
jgi:hypothetical protein